MKAWRPYLGRMVFTLLGLAAAILFLLIGFVKTIIILLCCGIGFTVGAYKDKAIRFPEWLWFWKNR